MTFEQSALLLAWVAILIMALALTGLLRQLRGMNRRTQSTVLETDRWLDVPEEMKASLKLDNASPALLLFVTPGCKACEARLRELAPLAAEEESVSFAAVFPEHANGFEGGGRIAKLEHKQTVFSQLRVPLTPYGVVLSREGAVTHATPVGSLKLLKQLVERAKTEGEV